MSNHEEIRSLLAQANLTVDEDQEFRDLFEQLARTVGDDREALAMISDKLEEYKRRIYDALESEQIDFDPDSFYKNPKH